MLKTVKPCTVCGIQVCYLEAVIFGPYFVPHNHDMDCGIITLHIMCVRYSYVFIRFNCIYMYTLVIDGMS